ncbi:thiamine-phosphate kinase [Angustibacter sp. Root456]|uniref:thiamine-phosphate kinase n=1 Tax=Angustibacter sp. Root456 TaxID=1736539 RepID=UPI0006F35BAB|nr:thiamine-phosphate kinase [Angustibacter sp. Root456]KQX70029.1 thiamine monophosphate kinase [Angustibacter sp. Root456]
MADDLASTTTLADVGEDGLLAAIFPVLPVAPSTLIGPGDDTAVVRAPDGRVVVTTDVLVEGRDFRRDWSSPQDVGWKAAAQNLADVAAMGAVPTALVVGLVAPAELPVTWAVGLAEGLAAACAGTGAGVVGGDLSSGPVVMVSVTALGDLQGRPAVLRSGARPGDVVAVAGRLGGSAAGLALLQAGRPDAAPDLVEAHRRPQPPYEAGPAAAQAGATAMLDVSDGLVRDLGRLARASGVAIDLDWSQLTAFAAPLAPALRALGRPDNGWGPWVLAGGEDHPLAATFPAGVVLPDGFTAVGQVLPPIEGRPPVLLDGEEPAVQGWDHFRP